MGAASLEAFFLLQTPILGLSVYKRSCRDDLVLTTKHAAIDNDSSIKPESALRYRVFTAGSGTQQLAPLAARFRRICVVLANNPGLVTPSRLAIPGHRPPIIFAPPPASFAIRPLARVVLPRFSIFLRPKGTQSGPGRQASHS
jgi:hypothetical protein